MIAMNDSVTVAITGASGVQYAVRLLQVLAAQSVSVYCVLSDTAKLVLKKEYDEYFPTCESDMGGYFSNTLNTDFSSIQFITNDDWYCAIASGSGAPKTMVVCPCSMGTLSAISCGASNSLIERAADVVIKERGNLIVVPRESPFSTIHLKNMLGLSEMGVCILPAVPSFYSNPNNINDLVDTVVQRIINQLPLAVSLIPAWGKCDEGSTSENK